eukprot:TRINITY_DN10102_c0_g1_i1.p1 TRINITY_DN10102_c0_g1~~TRINITY_DN10102_c0_g1_i1.p1  ORF type:complete len:264 (+),score=88.45 TRINITY_DN10102_c0_g1_i1:81-872(+)
MKVATSVLLLVGVAPGALAGQGRNLYQIIGDRCFQTDPDSEKQEGNAIAFGSLKKGTCKDQGYTKDEGSHTMKVPQVGDLKFEVYGKKASVVATATKALSGKDRSLYQLSGDVTDRCFQTEADSEKQEANAIAFGSLKKGTCKDQGYTKDEGSHTMKVPQVGDMKFEVYGKKASVVATATKALSGKDRSLYQLSGDVTDRCFQTEADSEKQEANAIAFGSLKKGTCKDQGYTEDEGSKTMKVPQVGDMKFEAYGKKASEALIV